MMFVSPSHRRPGLKMRKNIATVRGPGGVGCLALPPSSSESMKSNMFEALKRANVFHCSCCWHVLTSGVRFLLEVQVSGGIQNKYPNNMRVCGWYVDMNRSYEVFMFMFLPFQQLTPVAVQFFFEVHSPIVLKVSSTKLREIFMFYHFLSTQLVSMSNFKNFSLRKTIEVYSFLFPQHFRWGWKSPTGNPDCKASKTCRSNGGVTMAGSPS